MDNETVEIDTETDANEAIVRWPNGYAMFGGSRYTRERYAAIFAEFVRQDRLAMWEKLAGLYNQTQL